MTSKVIASATTHVTAGPNGAAVSRDGKLDIALPDPHPAAERLFGAAWSACFIGALQFAAAQQKVTLPATPEVDATIELNHGDDGFFLNARLDVAVPGVARDVAQALVEAAHQICPYSKATRGNIDVAVNLA